MTEKPPAVGLEQEEEKGPRILRFSYPPTAKVPVSSLGTEPQRAWQPQSTAELRVCCWQQPAWLGSSTF